MKKSRLPIVFSYLKDRRYPVLILVLTAVIFAAVVFLYGGPAGAVLYSLQLCAVCYLLFGVVDYFRYFRKIQALTRHLEMDCIYSMQIEPAANRIEQEYQQIVEKLLARQAQMADSQRRAMTELKDYYAVWAHQIKTPISAVNLLLQVMEQHPETVSVAELRQEVFKIDFYADAVMNYLRLEDLSTDFKFARYPLDSIVKKAVRKFAPQFIHKKIRIELAPLQTEVYTDERWLGFILEQLLSNAVKYTDPGGCVRIFMEGDSVLSVQDNGIGIRREDLPRIMERGFTGYNGRMDKKSSGIGLYLCRKAADKLGCKLEFGSEPGMGTKVCIDLTQRHLLHE